jgi:hypothetical protein
VAALIVLDVLAAAQDTPVVHHFDADVLVVEAGNLDYDFIRSIFELDRRTVPEVQEFTVPRDGPAHPAIEQAMNVLTHAANGTL